MARKDHSPEGRGLAAGMSKRRLWKPTKQTTESETMLRGYDRNLGHEELSKRGSSFSKKKRYTVAAVWEHVCHIWGDLGIFAGNCEAESSLPKQMGVL